MSDRKASLDQENFENVGIEERNGRQDGRDTFIPRPSDDPNDPLNFPMWLKVDRNERESGISSLTISR